MLFRFDQLGKNILRDFFGLLADAQTEVEVPPGDAHRIDLWLVPDPDRLNAHPEIPTGLLRSMAEQPAMVELWSQSPDAGEHRSAGRLDAGPRARARRRGSGEALQHRGAGLALVRLSFEVPAEMLPVEERDFIMQAREWYEQNLKQAEERGVLRGQVQGKLEGREWYEQKLKQAEERGEIRIIARFCGKRLGRALSEAETAALASLLARVGEDRVEQAVLSFSAEALGAWLADPKAQ